MWRLQNIPKLITNVLKLLQKSCDPGGFTRSDHTSGMVLDMARSTSIETTAKTFAQILRASHAWSLEALILALNYSKNSLKLLRFFKFLMGGRGEG